MQIISRKDAEKFGLKRYFTGLPCSKGHVDERAVDTYSCVSCIKERAAKKRISNGAIPRPKTDEERAERRKLSLQKYAEKHPDRLKESQKKYKMAHPEKRRAVVKKWDDENREYKRLQAKNRYFSNVEWYRKQQAVNSHNRRARIKKVGGTLSPNIFEKLFALQKGKCACCKADLKKVKPHIDHVYPIALGGPNTDDNVQLLCMHCNHQKSWRHPVDFMQDKGFLL